MISQELIDDLKEFKERGINFEIIEEGPKVYIFFKDFRIPSKNYNMETTDLLIFTTEQYPKAGFDMFWTDEKLTLKNGSAPASAEKIEPHLGKPRRRFSIHPYNTKPWDPAVDNVVTYMEYVMQRLRNGD